MKKVIIDKGKLKSLYHKQFFSSRAIAKIYNCDHGVILRNLRKYNLSVRKPKRKIKIPKGELENLYIKKKLSAYKIAKLYNCSSGTIYHKLKKFGMLIRPLKRVSIKRDRLYDLYFNKRLSLAAISKLYGCNPVTIFKKMKKYELSRRTSWETNEKHPKYNFSGNLDEKAYLLGFRAGDLGVRKTSEITGTIHVACSSTKLAQVQLIENLFKKYGPVWISKPNKRGVQSVDTLINSSFSFLLLKEDKISSWILKNKKYFVAYLAGYTDAEGSIGIYDNRAKFRIGSYDIGILREITKTLTNQGIKAILKLERKKETRKLNGDFWRITINEKNSLTSLFQLIRLHLKHSDRIKAMERAIKNIEERNKKILSRFKKERYE